jgi:hypothetical protein
MSLVAIKTSPSRPAGSRGVGRVTSGTRSLLPPASSPNADGSGINTNQPQGGILVLPQHVCVER